MITVALPTWNNRDILWLPFEGLHRQQVSEPWELIIFECKHKTLVAQGLIKKYEQALRKAECVDIKYLTSKIRLPLSLKWIAMAEAAAGDIMLLQASDDYPHPLRLAVTRRGMSGVNWYDCRFAYHYSVTSRRMIMYDMMTVQGPPTGFDIAIRTTNLRRVPKQKVRRSVDSWLFRNCSEGKRFIDENIYRGLATTGRNTISSGRERFYDKIQPPYIKANKKLDQIGLPTDIVTKLTWLQ